MKIQDNDHNKSDYSAKGSSPEFRIAIIAADTSGGDKIVAESRIQETKLIPILKDGKTLKLALVSNK